jgi:hypothetical protein
MKIITLLVGDRDNTLYSALVTELVTRLPPAGSGKAPGLIEDPAPPRGLLTMSDLLAAVASENT